MAIVVDDTFTDPDGTLLEAHTPEIGGAWVRASGAITITNGRLHGAGDPDLYWNAQEPGDPNVTVEAWYDQVTDVGQGGTVIVHYDEATDTGYHFAYISGPPIRILLSRVVSGASESLKSFSLGVQSGQTTKLTYQVTVNPGVSVNITVSENDVAIGTYSDTDPARIESRGKIAFLISLDLGYADNAAAHLSRLRVQAASIAGGEGASPQTVGLPVVTFNLSVGGALGVALELPVVSFALSPQAPALLADGGPQTVALPVVTFQLSPQAPAVRASKTVALPVVEFRLQPLRPSVVGGAAANVRRWYAWWWS